MWLCTKQQVHRIIHGFLAPFKHHPNLRLSIDLVWLKLAARALPEAGHRGPHKAYTTSSGASEMAKKRAPIAYDGRKISQCPQLNDVERRWCRCLCTSPGQTVIQTGARTIYPMTWQFDAIWYICMKCNWSHPGLPMPEYWRRNTCQPSCKTSPWPLAVSWAPIRPISNLHSVLIKRIQANVATWQELKFLTSVGSNMCSERWLISPRLKPPQWVEFFLNLSVSIYDVCCTLNLV